MSPNYYRIRDNGEDISAFVADDDQAAVQHVRDFLNTDHSLRAWSTESAEVVEWTNISEGEGVQQEYRRVAAVSDIG